MEHKEISGGRAVVGALAAQGVDTVFCVAGESYLPVLDALYDHPQIRVVTCRHESGASFMAESYAALTGRPGVLMVTRGPGACNASIGIHTARQSSAPVIMFVGLVSTADEGREAFQEFDLPQMFGSHAKHAAVIRSAADAGREVAAAFALAQSGRQGPVVLGLPEDVLSAPEGERVPAVQPVVRPSATHEHAKAVYDLIAGASRPVIIAGGSGWRDEDCHALMDLADASGIPVAASFRRQDLFSHTHDGYVGDIGFGPNAALVKYLKDADVVLLLGARGSEVLTQGYTLFGSSQKIIHVYPCASAFGRSFAPALAVEAVPGDIAALLASRDWSSASAWGDWRLRGRGLYTAWSSPPEKFHAWDGADMTRVFLSLRDLLPADAIVTTDAGNFSGWVNRYTRFGRPLRQVAPLSGAMGYAVPAAVACAIAAPGRTVLGVCGDGGFLMTAQEIATARQQGAKPIIMVCNNGIYGTIRMHQERDFPGRPVATDLLNPDFVKLAESYGAFGVRVDHADQFPAAWKAALGSGLPALIEIRMDPRQISTTSSL